MPADATGVELVEIVDGEDVDAATDGGATTASAPRIDAPPDEGGEARIAARERALGLLYESEAKAATVAAILDALPIDPDPFAAFLVQGVDRRRDEIDAHLVRVSRTWQLDRMPALDRAILRIGTFELLERPEVSVAVIINEAVELAKRFSTDDSSRFVNGVLNRLATDLR